MPTFQTEGMHTSEFLIDEEMGGAMRSREAITVVSGQNLVAGAVLGKITASGKYAEYDNAAVDGTEVAAGILFSAVDASAADATGVALVRNCGYKKSVVTWKTGALQADIDAGTADLEALGIIGRDSDAIDMP